MVKKITGFGIVVLLAVMAVNTATLTSKQMHPVTIASPLTRDYSPVLSAAIRWRTLAPDAGGTEENFQHLYQLLQTSFPLVHRDLTTTSAPAMSRLYRWQGHDSGMAAGLFAAHVDVVPAPENTAPAWTHPPFAGIIDGGYLWGRGSMDDKAGVVALLAATEELLQENFSPARTLYFAFGHDEETGGYEGAKLIAQQLARHEPSLAFVIDEGGPIVSGVVPGVDQAVALVGITEKGYANIQLQVHHSGGHASMPPPDSAISTLSQALVNLENHPAASHLNPAVQQMFMYLAPEMNWLKRAVFANLWLTKPLVLKLLAAKPSSNAVIRTTGVATLITGGTKENVLPTSATATLNYRLLPGDTPEALLARIEETVDNKAVAVSLLPSPQLPAAVSPTNGTIFPRLQRTIHEIYPEVLVAPYQLVAITDSRHYRQLTDNIYRFRPQFMGAQDLDRIHGVDERISIEDFDRLIRFYKRFIINIAS